MSDYGTLLRDNPQCANCGARFKLHESGTLRCPKNGQEAGPAIQQEWQDTKYSELIVEIINDILAPAQAREEEALRVLVHEIAAEMSSPWGTTDERESKAVARLAAALRTRQSALGCGYWNGIECMVDADAITSRAAARPSPQGEDALADERETLEHWDENDIGTLTNALESAIDAYDALRSRLASAKSSAQGEESREMREAIDAIADNSTPDEMGENADEFSRADWMDAYKLCVERAREARAALERNTKDVIDGN